MEETKKKKKGAVSYIWEVIGRQRWNIVAMTAIQILLAVFLTLQAGVLRNVVDRASEGNKDAFVKMAILLVALVLIQVVLRAIIRPLRAYVTGAIENSFKRRLFHTLLWDDYSYVAGIHSGEWMNRLTSDTKVIADTITEIIPDLTGMLFRLVGALIYMMILFPMLVYVIFPAGVVVCIVSLLFRWKMKKLHKGIQEADGDLRVYMTDHLQSMVVVRSFAQEDCVEKGAEERLSKHLHARMVRAHFSNLSQIAYAFFLRGTYLLAAVVCGYGILDGSISYGTFTAILELTAQIQYPIANMSGYLPRYYAMLASAERLMEAEDYLVERPEETEKEFTGLGLSNVDFAYKGEKESTVFTDFSIHVKRGDHVAVTGPSGSGKSTVLRLLMGLYHPEKGSAYLESGDEKIPLEKARRSLFAYVPQGNQLMSGTIREVVCFADKSGLHDDERISNALKIACADEFVNELDNGADTLLGERGTGLSEGQMQRIAIARAVYSECPILLLDEATSALDEATERRVLENLKKMTDKTVVIVTHRPAALKICDRILQFTENGVIEIGKE